VKGTEGGGETTEYGGNFLNRLTLEKMRKHIKGLVNYAEACDGEKIREELKRIVPEYKPHSAASMAHGENSNSTPRYEKLPGGEDFYFYVSLL